MKQIIKLLETWMEQGKTGQVEINFREGQIRNYTVRESFLVVSSPKMQTGNVQGQYQDKADRKNLTRKGAMY
ncbi:MAG: hypothetical protein JRG73_11250 [Deltaproteobacteria bacterium]|nr:hypothetical protein [Deltaproteobacteria bacterium]